MVDVSEGAPDATQRDARFPSVRVEQIMGTAISLDLRDRGVPDEAIEAAFERLREIDARFSTYRPDSEISRLNREELTVEQCSAEVREVLDRCEAIRALSRGSFDIRGHRADGALDPSGYVKGWAADAAAAILDAAGAGNYCLNAGGDVIARGEREAGRPWRIGIRHPERPDRLATVLESRDLAVATSGGYERGAHIVDPPTGRAPEGLLSVTVVGRHLAEADAYATAAYAMGRRGLAWIASLPGYAGCMITTERRLVWTEGFDRYKVPS
ncbi:MAG TPA: FAD:protein FMN transferase [Candidatus Limnocylindrales bacterium]|nr:FAD:protein FMN transferase [Candidatus Limnocylindrales bacterium]